MKRRVTTQINLGFYNFILNLWYSFIRSSERRLGSNPGRVACLSQLHTHVSYIALVHDETSRLVHCAIVKEPVYTARHWSLHNGAQRPCADAAVYTKLTEMHIAPCYLAAYSAVWEALRTERLCVVLSQGHSSRLRTRVTGIANALECAERQPKAGESKGRHNGMGEGGEKRISWRRVGGILNWTNLKLVNEIQWDGCDFFKFIIILKGGILSEQIWN